MPTAKKLWLGFGTLLAALLLFSATTLVLLRSIEEHVDETAQARDLSAAARQLKVHVLGYALRVRTFLQGDDPNSLREAAKDVAGLERTLAEYQRLATTDQEREMASRFSALWREFQALGHSLTDGANRQATQEELTRFRDLRIALERILDEEIQPAAIERYDAASRAARQAARTTIVLTLVLVIVCLSIGLATSILVGRGIVQAEKNLSSSLKRFQTLVASISQIVWITNDAGEVIDEFHGWERFTGQSRTEMHGAGWTAAVHTDDRAQAGATWAQARVTQQAFEMEFRARRTDGQWRHLVSRGVPMFDAHGFLVEWVGVCMDITDRRQAEANLGRTVRDLERSNAELEQFAYVASHDLQEPLRAVSGCVQIIQKRYQGQLDAHADELIGHTVAGAARMQTLINDLLTYSRVATRGKEFAPADCNTAVKQALASLEVAVKESGATITVAKLPTVEADAAQLAQLFQNLIGNAVKYRGDRPVEIRVAAERQDSGWRFSVRDNGIGMAPEYFERIFVIFQRLHTRKEYAGTGIGLAICKKVVERHGGRIWVESAPGQGSTFYFTLPDRGAKP